MSADPARPRRAESVEDERWREALRAAELLALDPRMLGGAALRAPAGPVRDAWLAHLRACFDALAERPAPYRRAPARIDEERLVGGLDLPATLRTGAPVVARGVLADADGGLVVLAMAERLPAGVAAIIARVVDEGVAHIARAGIAQTFPARIAVIALDEGIEADERPPAALVERLAFLVDLSDLSPRDVSPAPAPDARLLRAAHAAHADVAVAPEALEALCAAAMRTGVSSIRAPLQALRAARALAALDGRSRVNDDDVALAFRLVVAPRALHAPPQESADEDGDGGEADGEEPSQQQRDAEQPDPEDESAQSLDVDALTEIVLAAARANLPAALLDGLAPARGVRETGGRGASAPKAVAGARGRPAPSRPGRIGRGARLDIVATLRAAAPWQPLRRRAFDATDAAAPRVIVGREDFRIVHRRPKTARTSIFVVDASGSSAINRLAEAKGAVELLLAECYIRRDSVALIAFRGAGAELLLPPTRSLTRAKRQLASLPGGGATPLAAGIDAAAALAASVARKGDAPSLVIMTDGRGNVGRDAAPGREAAERDALAAAAALREIGAPTLLVDISPRGQPKARALAERMGARYLALPGADAHSLSAAVNAALPARSRHG